MFSPSEEEEDEFQKYYGQFRPTRSQHYSPTPSSYYSSYSSYGKLNHDTDRCSPSVYRGYPRSTSHGRDFTRPRRRTVDQEIFDTDNVSRDSGHSSASSATPDWRLTRRSDDFSRSDSITSQRPVILPRRSLEAKASLEPPRRSLAYLVITISIAIGSLAILSSAYTKQSCHINDQRVWDLQELKENFRDKVIGQNNPIGKLDGPVDN